MRSFKVDNLTTNIYKARDKMGEAAAADIRAKIKELLETKPEINMIFAAAPSQNDVLKALLSYTDIEWNRINAYHMDEYIALFSEDKDKSFGTYLKEHIFDKAPFKSVNLIDATATNAEAECKRYAKILRENPTDIVVMGIGENGHIAFNDPPVADFEDKLAVKVVRLDEVCRQQQVNDGCFPTIDRVPTHAITLTCPTLFSGGSLFCIVPAKTKADAVYKTLNSEISEKCPATILRRHTSAVLYLDAESSAKL